MKKLIVLFAIFGMNHNTALAQTVEDIVSAPSNAFLGIGIGNASTLVALPNCKFELIAGAISDGSGAGSFSRFQRQSNSFWQDLGKTTRASGTAGADHYGRALASTKVGNTTLLAVGAPEASNGGLVEIFGYHKNSNNWVYQQTLTVSDASITDASAEFGYSLSMQGNHLLVGMPGRDSNAGGMVLYEFSNGQFNFVRAHQSPLADSRAGESAALSLPDYAVGMPFNSLPATTSPGGLLGYFATYLEGTRLRVVEVEVGAGLTQAGPGDRCGASIVAPFDKSPSQFYIGCTRAARVVGLPGPQTIFELPLFQGELSFRHPDDLFNVNFGAALSYTPQDGGKLIVTSIKSALSTSKNSFFVYDYDNSQNRFGPLTDRIDSPFPGGPNSFFNFGSDAAVAWPFVNVGVAQSNQASTPAPPNSSGNGGDGTSGQHVIYNLEGAEPACSDDSLCFPVFNTNKEVSGLACL
ncbi:MAG: hypothetical protein AAF197_01635 [Pseudomonadota bacterium]